MNREVPRLVRLDLNSPEFQAQFLALERTMLSQVVGVLARLRKMACIDVYRSEGLKWEKSGRTAAIRVALAVRRRRFSTGLKSS
jgi:hypothetical protein